MNIGIIFFTAVANGLLQAMSKNIIYCYVFLIYTLGAMAIDLYDKKWFFFKLCVKSKIRYKKAKR